MAVHPNDVFGATDNVAGQDLSVSTLAKNAGCEGINSICSNVVVDGDQVEDIELASAELASPTFAITLAWGFDWPSQSWGGLVWDMGVACREIRWADGVGKVTTGMSWRGVVTWW